ncbi:MAG: hypothetical protein J5J00_17500 [Deltaproteobacteria bacterium]|nr:hypothetical protein [Deltaproteobacteria bacterium]
MISRELNTGTSTGRALASEATPWHEMLIADSASVRLVGQTNLAAVYSIGQHKQQNDSIDHCYIEAAKKLQIRQAAFVNQSSGAIVQWDCQKDSPQYRVRCVNLRVPVGALSKNTFDEFPDRYHSPDSIVKWKELPGAVVDGYSVSIYEGVKVDSSINDLTQNVCRKISGDLNLAETNYRLALAETVNSLKTSSILRFCVACVNDRILFRQSDEIICFEGEERKSVAKPGGPGPGRWEGADHNGKGGVFVEDSGLELQRAQVELVIPVTLRGTFAVSNSGETILRLDPPLALEEIFRYCQLKGLPLKRFRAEVRSELGTILPELAGLVPNQTALIWSDCWGKMFNLPLANRLSIESSLETLRGRDVMTP